MLGPPGTVVTSAAPLGMRTWRILMSPSRKYTASLLALTGGGATTPSCCPEQNCVEAVATGTDAATLASVLMRFSIPAERTSPYGPLRGMGPGDTVAEPTAVG